MADRIFPNRIQDEALDSDLVFQGIDWDNFNERLAKAKEPKKMDDETKEMLKGLSDKKKPSEEDTKDLSEVPPQFLDNVKKRKKMHEDDETEEEESDEHDHEDNEDDEDDEKDGKGPMKRKGPKSKDEKKKSYAFNHPSQISAEAIEVALANGDQELANVILAVRHERRVRLAEKIERQIVAQNTQNVKLAQRKAYRQNIVNSLPVETSKKEVVNSDEFVKVSSMNNSARKAFAAKAIQNGFPAEYVQAMLGEKVKVDNLSDIKKVMASELEPNVKVAAIKSMTKVATLTNDDYKRLKDYWKNELGYAEAWVDELFTQEYDK
jgi:hypothetical protein